MTGRRIPIRYTAQREPARETLEELDRLDVDVFVASQDELGPNLEV